jgi:hypothetical protein
LLGFANEYRAHVFGGKVALQIAHELRRLDRGESRGNELQIVGNREARAFASVIDGKYA